MPYFVINGYPDCPNYMHAIYVAQYLSEHLPNFEYKRVELTTTEWTATKNTQLSTIIGKDMVSFDVVDTKLDH
ncbi:hypothetical protein NQ317_018850 [Molorchus minor]|uniref:GST N-terminal domain-containing protein n=1 Tax=Molorchus minor TaxID=1323400 RepID=A0ABQ9J8D9_9CUCU|nr:hypothetical protein NQ317_018850 [Molorchus minor]